MAAYEIFQADCFDWLCGRQPHSIHAVCTDPPYGLLEFSPKELAKLRGQGGGVWRLPPRIGGHERDPLPRFTILTAQQRQQLYNYMRDWGRVLYPTLVPGAHVCIAGHPMLQYLVQGGMAESGFEVRPAILRLYRGFRGGDRPKNAEAEFPAVCVTPKSAYEPWMLFRKPLSERTVAENLRRWGTGGLRRPKVDQPLPEVIPSERTPAVEAAISAHPCLKPQRFLRVMVRALLPLGEGVILDPFLGSGSTVAAAVALGYAALGIEIDPDYYLAAQQAIPQLASLYPNCQGTDWEVPVVSPQNPTSLLAKAQSGFGF